jgi:hypothetical protein
LPTRSAGPWRKAGAPAQERKNALGLLAAATELEAAAAQADLIIEATPGCWARNRAKASTSIEGGRC